MIDFNSINETKAQLNSFRGVQLLCPPTFR
uniref:Uncharacterized protein n=1 Tax=Rhizophora mucronata TaxID=61149 RepID=A0A2P2NRM8_RHIMU